MEKYGVEERDDLDTTNKKCPICGEDLIDPNLTGVLICPVHGSAPFEETVK